MSHGGKVLSILEERATLLDRASALIELTEKETRALQPAERTELDRINVRVNRLADEAHALDSRIIFSRSDGKNLEMLKAELKGSLSTPMGPQLIGEAGGHAARAFTVDGAELPLLRREQRCCDAWPRRMLPGGINPQELRFGRIVKGIATGDWSDAQAERRALSVGMGSEGGFLVPSEVSDRFIDLARSKSVIMEAGALTLPLNAAETTIGRLDTDPTATWKAENQTITEDTAMRIGAYTLRPKTLASLVALSVELVADGQNLEQIVENAISAAMALQLDQAILRGSGGSTEVKGIKTWSEDPTPKVAVKSLAGPITYDAISDELLTIENQNGAPNAWITSPRTLNVLRKSKDGQGQYLKFPDWFASLIRLSTTSIPTNLGGGSNETEAYLGDFTQLIVGIRSGVELAVSREAGDAFKKAQVWVRGLLRADMVLTRPNHFVVIDQITP